MTVIVGVHCNDGVVIGADSAVTFSAGKLRTIEQKTDKIEIIENSIIVAGSGSVGLNQRFKEIVATLYSEKYFSSSKSKSPVEIGKLLSKRAIEDFSSTSVEKGKYGALVAFPYSSKAHLCELSLDDLQPELKDEKIWYVSIGSGQHIADPFLGLMRDVFWKDELPNCEDAIFAVYWALEHAISVNPGGINEPIRIALLKKNADCLTAKLLADEEMDEHRGNIKGAKDHLRKYIDEIRGKGKALDLPKVL